MERHLGTVADEVTATEARTRAGLPVIQFRFGTSNGPQWSSVTVEGMKMGNIVPLIEQLTEIAEKAGLL